MHHPAPTRDPGALTDARLQLHWACQPLAAAADTVYGLRDDDSQSNFDFDPGWAALLTHPLDSGWTLGLRVTQPALLALHHGEVRDSLPLEGQTLPQLLHWVNHQPALGEESEPAELRGYDLPHHAVRDGGEFDTGDHEAFTALAWWLTTGFDAVDRATRDHHATHPRLWPHHFDVGAIIPLADDRDPRSKPSVGLGMSLGDATYDRPYFYVNPYPLADPPPAADRPDPPDPMHWADAWFGIILLSEPGQTREGVTRTLTEAVDRAAGVAEA
mgnify:CR=1 FL=1